MLGPIVALLLLTSPAAPVAQQSCWLLCSSPTPAPLGPSLLDRVLGQDPESLRQRVETLERQQQPSLFPSTRPDYSTPSRPSLLFPDSSSTRCTSIWC